MFISRREFLLYSVIVVSGLMMPKSGNRAASTFPISHYLDDLTKLPLAGSCLICDKEIAEIGGQQIVHSYRQGARLFHQSVLARVEYPKFRVVFKPFAEQDFCFGAWGGKSVFTNSVIKRAYREYLNGEQPWHCQICGKMACHLCGKPLVALPFGTYAYEENGRGYYSKGANLGANLGCIDPRCPSSEYFNNKKRSEYL